HGLEAQTAFLTEHYADVASYSHPDFVHLHATSRTRPLLSYQFCTRTHADTAEVEDSFSLQSSSGFPQTVCLESGEEAMLNRDEQHVQVSQPGVYEYDDAPSSLKRSGDGQLH